MSRVKHLETEILAKEIFALIVGDCTWGNSKVGGPVWVMDFRFESLKKRFLKNQIIWSCLTGFDESSGNQLSAKLAEIAEKYVYYHQICNVMVIHDCLSSGTQVSFYSLLSFCKLLNRVLGYEEIKGAPLSQVSFILVKQNGAIKNDDYIWCVKWRIGAQNQLSFPDFERRGYGISYEDGKYMFLPYAIPRFVELCNVKHRGVDGKIFELKKWRYTKGTMMVERIYDWEVYLPLVIYDMMELLNLNYFENFKLAKNGEFQYPLVCYGRLADSYSCFVDKNLVSMPMPAVGKLFIPSWHKRFEPKSYWQMKDFPDVGQFII